MTLSRRSATRDFDRLVDEQYAGGRGTVHVPRQMLGLHDDSARLSVILSLLSRMHSRKDQNGRLGWLAYLIATRSPDEQVEEAWGELASIASPVVLDLIAQGVEEH